MLCRPMIPVFQHTARSVWLMVNGGHYISHPILALRASQKNQVFPKYISGKCRLHIPPLSIHKAHTVTHTHPLSHTPIQHLHTTKLPCLKYIILLKSLKLWQEDVKTTETHTLNVPFHPAPHKMSDPDLLATAILCVLTNDASHIWKGPTS